MKILVVDDNALDRQLIEAYLKSDDRDVILLDSGQEAINYLNQDNPDLVLLDLHMPGLDGYATAKKIREKYHYDNWIPIIFISTDANAENIEQAITDGGDDYITKPVNKAVLNAKILSMQRLWVMQRDMNEHMRLLGVANEQLLNVISDLRQETEKQKEAESIIKLQLRRLETTNEKLSRLRKEERFKALHDPLTSVANRALFEEFIDEEIKKNDYADHRFALLFIDLDGFKTINDCLGHAAGDQLLVDVADRLRECTKRSDLVARFGGDEFCIAMTDLNSIEDAAELARDILFAIDEPFIINNELAHVTASIGISIFPNDGQTYLELSQHADVAMYTAKSSGKNKACYYANELQKAADEKLLYRDALTDALTTDALSLFYQPIIDIENQTVFNAECFIRWHRDDEHIELPLQFLPVAENAGILEDIERWMLSNACSQLQKWQKECCKGLRLSLNVSMQQLYEENFHSLCLQFTEKHHISPSDISIEVCERDLEKHYTKIKPELMALSESGFHLTLDNFGTGLTSLRFLYELPLKHIKANVLFFEMAQDDQKMKALVDSLLKVTEEMNIRVIAGKVEKKEHIKLLKERGIHLLQGYYFAKPSEAALFEKAVSEYTGKG